MSGVHEARVLPRASIRSSQLLRRGRDQGRLHRGDAVPCVVAQHLEVTGFGRLVKGPAKRAVRVQVDEARDDQRAAGHGFACHVPWEVGLHHDVGDGRAGHDNRETVVDPVRGQDAAARQRPGPSPSSGHRRHATTIGCSNIIWLDTRVRRPPSHRRPAGPGR